MKIPTIDIETIFTKISEIKIFFINLYSADFLFPKASITFQKLLVGTISSIYFGATQDFTR
jgi:hypothetical protein